MSDAVHSVRGHCGEVGGQAADIRIRLAGV